MKERKETKKIIIHCSATIESKDIRASDIRRWHKNRGWSDIGYHFIIRLDGSIELGRDLKLVGAHCYGKNAESVGICYIGGLNLEEKPKDTRTEAQKNSLKSLIETMHKIYPKATVHGHNEFSNKKCPCFDVKKEF